MQGRLGDNARLQHILDAIAKIEAYITEQTFESFEENSMMLDACIRQLQIIGEACNKVSKALQEENQDVPWSQIIGLRIIVVHHYFGVDKRIIWDVVKKDLAPLKAQVIRIIQTLE